MDIDIVSHNQNGYKTGEIWLYVASSTLTYTQIYVYALSQLTELTVHIQ